MNEPTFPDLRAFLEQLRRDGDLTVVEARDGQEALPIVLSGDIESFWDATNPGVPRSGMRAALDSGYQIVQSLFGLADGGITGILSERDVVRQIGLKGQAALQMPVSTVILPSPSRTRWPPISLGRGSTTRPWST